MWSMDTRICIINIKNAATNNHQIQYSGALEERHEWNQRRVRQVLLMYWNARPLLKKD